MYFGPNVYRSLLSDMLLGRCQTLALITAEIMMVDADGNLDLKQYLMIIIVSMFTESTIQSP